MKAMLIRQLGKLTEQAKPLVLDELPRPEPGEGEVLIRVSCCGVCHTELDEIEGRTPPTFLPMIPGHQVVGKVIEVGSGIKKLKLGDRVGVAWIYWACGQCSYCKAGMENLCPQFMATGRDAHGGYAEYMTIHENYAYRIPPLLSDTNAAPLLCAGAIGFRSLRLTGVQNGENLGLTGFGASAHLVMKMAKYQFPKSRVFVFARNPEERQFAMDLGAYWSGDTCELPPEQMQSIIDTTPVWTPVVAAMASLKPGGRLVINAIRKENADQGVLTGVDYSSHLWMEKEIKSVANITRQDVEDFLELAVAIPIKPQVQEYELTEANQALLDLKFRHVRGAKVLMV